MLGRERALPLLPEQLLSLDLVRANLTGLRHDFQDTIFTSLIVIDAEHFFLVTINHSYIFI